VLRVTDKLRQGAHSLDEERPNLIDFHGTKSRKLRARQKNIWGGDRVTYTEFTVVQFCYTFAALGLPRLPDVFEKGSDFLWALEIG